MDYYLYDHPNPNAPVRSNGLRFWGYPSRIGGVDPDVIVIHTAENIPDVNPPDTGAESIADYFDSNIRPASAHTVLDTDSVIELLPPTAVAFHVRNYNTRGLGLEIATQARKWNEVPDEYASALFAAAARKSAEWVREFGIPVRFRTRTEIDAGLPGFTGHTNLDPTRRSDPGFTTQQWTEFLELVQREVDEDMSNTLRLGHTGNAVVGVQQALNRFLTEFGNDADHIEVTGVFDQPTADLVKRYQTAAQLPDVTGEVDASTLSWLHEYRVDKADPTDPASRPLKTETVSFKVVTGYAD